MGKVGDGENSDVNQLMDQMYPGMASNDGINEHNNNHSDLNKSFDSAQSSAS